MLERSQKNNFNEGEGEGEGDGQGEGEVVAEISTWRTVLRILSFSLLSVWTIYHIIELPALSDDAQTWLSVSVIERVSVSVRRSGGFEAILQRLLQEEELKAWLQSYLRGVFVATVFAPDLVWTLTWESLYWTLSLLFTTIYWVCYGALLALASFVYAIFFIVASFVYAIFFIVAGIVYAIFLIVAGIVYVIFLALCGIVYVIFLALSVFVVCLCCVAVIAFPIGIMYAIFLGLLNTM